MASDWTRQAAEQICREIFASVAYPDEALIERVRKVIGGGAEEAEARAASSKSAAESLAEDFNTLSSEVTMWRGKYETFCRERDRLEAQAAAVRSLAKKWSDPEFWKDDGCRMDSSDCCKALLEALKSDAGRALLERLRQAEAENATLKENLKARLFDVLKFKSQRDEARAEAATARREAVTEAADICTAKANYCEQVFNEKYKPGSLESQMMTQLRVIMLDTAKRIRALLDKESVDG